MVARDDADRLASALMAPPLRKNRDFVLLWSGLAVSVLGSRISQIGYPLIALSLTQSPAQAGLVGFAGTLPYLLFQLPAGIVVDRVDRRRLMLLADLVRATALASVVVAYRQDALGIVQLLLVAFVEGTFFVFFNLGERAAVRFVVPPQQLPTAIAQSEARNRAAILAGRAIGGFLFELSRVAPFAADALSYIASIVCLLLIRSTFGEQREEADRSLRRAWAEVVEGLRWLGGHAFLRASAVLVAGLNFVSTALLLVLVVLAKRHGASPAGIGAILAAGGIGGLIASVLSRSIQRRVPAKLVVVATPWVWFALLTPSAFANTSFELGALYAGIAFMSPPWNVVVNAYQLALVPDRLLGRVASAGFMAAYGAQPLGSLAAGLLLSTLGGRDATLVIAAFTLTLGLAALASAGIRSAPTLEEAQTSLSPAPS